VILGGLLLNNLRKLTDAMVKAGWEATKTWIKAAAPFIAIGVAIGALLLILDDIRGYMNGEDSVFGDFMKALDEWLVPKAEDTWFVKAIKFFVEQITKALRMLEELKDSLGIMDSKNVDRRYGKSDKAVGLDADNITLATAKERLRLGKGLTKAETGAISRSGVSQQAFEARYRGGANAPPVSKQQTNNITVMQQPGEDSKGLADRIHGMLKDSWGEMSASDWEEAQAHLGQ